MRATGRTTRQVDSAIQELFRGGTVIVTDHYQTREATKNLVRKIERRLWDEHNLNVTVMPTTSISCLLTLELPKGKSMHWVDAILERTRSLVRGSQLSMQI